ncbi:C40 family peptidase [Alteribacter natronophilus]|uniref:C40 family peptidase n=1 Tax=Alteribacter natronophilus TaxID=2583810 RepID=UPI0014869A7A|nr:C40 family peptidase [Alteribacter natronophilus]
MNPESLIRTGLSQLGKPYKFNARPLQTKNFDCSSFIQHIHSEHGVALPRTSRQQYLACTPVAIDDLQPGDLLFFTTRRRRKREGISKIGHVALYIGKGRILHTYRPHNKVTVSKMKGRWKKTALAAGRPRQQ